MAGLLAGTAYVDIKPRLDGSFGTKLRSEVGAITKSISNFTSKDLEGSFRKLGQSTSLLGGQLTKGLTVPLIGAGVVAAKFAMDFGREMANVATLIPGATGRVDELKDAVQEMAVDVGTSTSDLSGGLYQVISAFGDTADTVKILETNAKAAKAGVASTTDAINLTSAVTKSYGDTSAEAVTHVADLALKTVELGQTTFPELAGSIGLVTPLAASLGVTVEDLFGTMSTFSGVTGSASEVSTQLRGVLQALLAPTESMTALFDQLGVSSGEALIGEYGLAGATQLIVEAAAAAGRPLQDYIGSIEGQTLALAGAAGQADTWTEKVGQMGDTAGTLEEKFETMTSGVGESAFQFDQAKAAAEVAAQRLGEALAPAIGMVLRDIVPLAVNVGEFAAALLIADGWMGTAARTLGVMAVAAGPTIWALGKVTSATGSVVGALKSTREAFSLYRLGVQGAAKSGDGFAAGAGRLTGALGVAGTAGALAIVGTAVYGVVDAWQRSAANARASEERIGDLTAAIREQGDALGENTQAWLTSTLLDPSGDMGRAFSRVLADMGLTVDDLEAALSSGGSELDGFAGKVSRHAKEMGETDLFPDGIDVLSHILPKVGDEWAEAGEAAKTAGEVTGTAGDKVKDAGEKAKDGAGGTEQMTRALGRVGQAAETAQDSVDRFQTAIDSLLGLQLDAESAQIRWRDSLVDLADTIDENGNTLDINTEKGRANRQAMIDTTQAALVWADALVSQTGNADAASIAIAQNADQLVKVATEAGLSGDAALNYAADILGIPDDARTDIHNNADLAAAAVAEYRKRIDAVPKKIITDLEARVKVFGDAVVQVAGGSIQRYAQGGYFPAREGGYVVNIAEGGHDEIVLPIENKPRARQILETAGVIQQGEQSAHESAGPGVAVSQTVHFHGSDIPSLTELDAVNRKMGMRLALLGRRGVG